MELRPPLQPDRSAYRPGGIPRIRRSQSENPRTRAQGRENLDRPVAGDAGTDVEDQPGWAEGSDVRAVERGSSGLRIA